VTQKNPTILNLAMNAMRFSSFWLRDGKYKPETRSRRCARYWTRRARDCGRKQPVTQAEFEIKITVEILAQEEGNGDALFP